MKTDLVQDSEFREAVLTTDYVALAVQIETDLRIEQDNTALKFKVVLRLL